MAVALRVVVYFLGYEGGYWCRPCARSGGVRLDFAKTLAGRPASMWSEYRCTDCGGDEVDPVAEGT